MLPLNNHISKGLETIVWKYINLIRHIIVTRWKHTRGHNWWPYLNWSSLGKWCAAWLGVHRCVAQRPILLMKIHSKIHQFACCWSTEDGATWGVSPFSSYPHISDSTKTNWHSDLGIPQPSFVFLVHGDEGCFGCKWTAELILKFNLG